MKKVVIAGAGFAGLHIFYKLRHLIGIKIEITVIDPRGSVQDSVSASGNS